MFIWKSSDKNYKVKIVNFDKIKFAFFSWFSQSWDSIFENFLVNHMPQDLRVILCTKHLMI